MLLLCQDFFLPGIISECPLVVIFCFALFFLHPCKTVCFLVFLFKSLHLEASWKSLILWAFIYLICFPFICTSLLLWVHGLGLSETFLSVLVLFFPLSIWWVKNLLPYSQYISHYHIPFPALKYERIMSCSWVAKPVVLIWLSQIYSDMTCGKGRVSHVSSSCTLCSHKNISRLTFSLLCWKQREHYRKKQSYDLTVF